MLVLLSCPRVSYSCFARERTLRSTNCTIRACCFFLRVSISTGFLSLCLFYHFNNKLCLLTEYYIRLTEQLPKFYYYQDEKLGAFDSINYICINDLVAFRELISPDGWPGDWTGRRVQRLAYDWGGFRNGANSGGLVEDQDR